MNCDYKDSGILSPMAADKDSSKECDQFVDYLQKRQIEHTELLSKDQINLELGTLLVSKGCQRLKMEL